MFFNPNVFLAIPLGVTLFFVGKLLARKVAGVPMRIVLLSVFLLACLPSLLFIGYYLHLFGEPLWYVEWRSRPYTELLSPLCGLLFGFIAPRKSLLSPIIRGTLHAPIVLVFILLGLAPYLKPIMLPVSVGVTWKNEWNEGVCLQNSAATCGPASLATLLAQYNIKRTEREIAQESYSCASGTEIWYLMRYARKQGVPVICRHRDRLADVSTPAMIGTRLGIAGHFIVLFDVDNGQVTFGDPLGGRSTVPEDKFRQVYEFSGCALEVE